MTIVNRFVDLEKIKKVKREQDVFTVRTLCIRIAGVLWFMKVRNQSFELAAFSLLRRSGNAEDSCSFWRFYNPGVRA